MRIATYNFLSGGSDKRSGHWRAIRKHIAPDILLTQEAKPCDAKSYPHKTHLWQQAEDRRWGTGLITSTHEIKPVEVPGFAGWITGGEIATSTKPIRVFSVHAPPGKHGYVRTVHEMVDSFKDAARGADLVLGGDFNVAVGFRGPAERVKMSKAERTVLQRIVDELDLVACWQTANPDVPLAQTLRWTGNRRAPYHCDGIFVPRSWLPRLKSCVVLSGRRWNRLSDHNPVVADFD